jgi:hypothetical protein
MGGLGSWIEGKRWGGGMEWRVEIRGGQHGDMAKKRGDGEGRRKERDRPTPRQSAEEVGEFGAGRRGAEGGEGRRGG